MDNKILNSYSKITNLDVSRETCNELERLITMIQEKNKEINIISREIYEKEQIRERHIIDSAQIIEFVDLNSDTTCDLGTGGGMPGLIVAIMMKKLKNSLKVNLYEKSYHKCVFLKEVSKKMNLNINAPQAEMIPRAGARPPAKGTGTTVPTFRRANSTCSEKLLIAASTLALRTSLDFSDRANPERSSCRSSALRKSSRDTPG